MKLLLLLGLLGLGAAASPATPRPVTLSDALLTSAGGQTLVTSPNWALQGTVEGVAPAGSSWDCAAACAGRPDCQWANFCPLEEGCTDGTSRLGYQQCQLLGGNGTVFPEGVHGADITTTAVFLLTAPPETFPGFASLPAQGQAGADFECAGSILPGACAFQSPFDAVAICVWLTDCRAVTVFANGTDGRSEPVAVLKSSALATSNSFLAPSVYSLQQTEAFPLVALYLHPREAEVVVPTDAELLAEAAESAGAGSGGTAANSTAWLGCIIANHSLMAGEVVDVVDGVEDAKECCMLCRTASGGACNAWNWCQRADGCSYKDDSSDVSLQQFQCELRFQSLVVPKFGWPAALLGKGPDIPFVSGTPLVTVAPPVPGYKRLLGSGLFGQRGFTCPESLKPQIQECVRSASLEGHAQFCDADPRCAAFAYKPAGVYDSVRGTALYKPTANSSAIILTPSTALYIKEEPQTSSSLPPGAIVGISLGSAALVAAAAALLLRRRRRRRLEREKRGADVETPASSASLPGADGVKHSSQPSKVDSEGAAPAGEPSSGVAVPVARPPRPSSQHAASAASCQPMSHRQINVPAPMAPSPFAAASMHAFASPLVASPPTAAIGSPASAGNGVAVTPARSGLPPDRWASLASAASRDAPMPELMRLVEQQDLLQESARSTLDVGAQLLALPSNLPPELTSWVIDPAEITLLTWPNGHLRELGKGASGRVLKAVYRGEVVAAKEIDLGRNLDTQRAFVQEALRMQQLRHPAVLSFYGVSLDGPRGIILSEFCEGRDLHSALQLRSATRGERVFGWYGRGRRVALDIAKALNYLHSEGVVHMDVKSSNVLLTASGGAKLGDVGLSRRQNRTYLSDVGAVGTFDWAAPEILMNGMQCTAAVDLFSFGVLLYEIVTGERPVRGRLRIPTVPDECPEAAKELLLQCLSVDPSARPTAQEAMQRLAQMQRASPQASTGGQSAAADA